MAATKLIQKATRLVWPASIVEILFMAAVYFAVMFLIKGVKKEDFKLVRFIYKK